MMVLSKSGYNGPRPLREEMHQPFALVLDKVRKLAITRIMGAEEKSLCNLFPKRWSEAYFFENC